jgi:hypothetical protein
MKVPNFNITEIIINCCLSFVNSSRAHYALLMTTELGQDILTGAGGVTFASVIFAASDNDVFSKFFHWYAATTANMSTGLFWWFVKAAAALEFETILCALIFKSHRANLSAGSLMAINWSIFLLGWLLVSALPLQSLPVSPAHRGWILAVSLLAIAILPNRLAGLLVPKEIWRRNVAVSLYLLLALLLAIQLLFV